MNSTRYPQATISNTEVSLLSSTIIGDTFKISVALPKDYAASDVAYPAVYLLDANLFFGLVTDTLRILQFNREAPEIILIGIGYPDDSQHLGLRFRDYTPTEDEHYTRRWLANISKDRSIPVDYHGSGGAREFLAFIDQELIPFLQGNYHILPEDNTLAGDSLSGLFALYTLFHQTDLFNQYIIGSPSLWWGDKITFTYEANYAAKHTDLPAKVFMSVGALEINEPEPAAMVENMQALAGLLGSRTFKSLELTTHVFENETHLSVIPATMSRGLRTVYGPQPRYGEVK